MGDPTVRMHPLAPPASASASASAGQATISWPASPDADLGYHVYRGATASGPFTRLTTSLVTGTSYIDVVSGGGTFTYLVKAVRRETTPSGTYFNASQGAFSASVTIPSGPNQAPVITAAVTTGTTITASWSGVASPTTSDWIGLYRAGDPDTNWISYRYNTGGTASGSVGFDAPVTAGRYEFRYFYNATWTKLATSNSVTVANDLLAYWKLDDGSGTTALDSSGRGNNGTLINGPAWVSGHAGGALSLAGRDDIVDCGSSTSLDLTDNFSVTVWFKANAYGNYGGLVSHQEYPSSGGWGLVQNGNRLSFISFKNGSWTSLDVDANPPAGTWHHLAALVRNGTRYLYLDGVQQAATDTSLPGPSATAKTVLGALP